MVAERTDIVVSMNWIKFDTDDHSTLVISLQTSHGRNTPLLWKTHQKSLLKGQRNADEKALLNKLKKTLPEGFFVNVVADCGFGYMELFERLEQDLDIPYIIGFIIDILVDYPGVEQVPASEYLTPTGRYRTLKEVVLTGQRQWVERIYCCHRGSRANGAKNRVKKLKFWNIETYETTYLVNIRATHLAAANNPFHQSRDEFFLSASSAT